MTRPPENPNKVRVPLVLSAEELRQLEDWQFAHRHRTRTAALKAMMQIAIEAMPAPAMPKARKAKRPEGGE